MHNKPGEESTSSRSFTAKTYYSTKPFPGAASWLKAKHAKKTKAHNAEKEIKGQGRKKQMLSDSHDGSDQAVADELLHISGMPLTRDRPVMMQDENGCFSPDQPQCSQPAVATYRTIDGSCNNLDKPLQGAAGSQYDRLIPAWYEDGIGTPRGHRQAMSTGENEIGPFQPPLPSAHLVSEAIIRDRQLDYPTCMLTHIFMQWGQFITHDMALTTPADSTANCASCEFVEGKCEPILVSEGDPTLGADIPLNAQCIPCVRSAAACSNSNDSSPDVREQINSITAYLDGNTLYGSSTIVEDAVRFFKMDCF